MNKFFASQMKSQKGHALLIVVLIAAAIGGYFIYTNYSNNRTKVTPPTVTHSSPAPTGAGETANWKTYSNTSLKYSVNYSFKYPADYVPYFPNKPDNNVFHSADAKFDKKTTAKTSGIEIGSLVYGVGEDKEDYKGQNTKIDAILVSKMILPIGVVAKAYINLEDITVTIDDKKDNKDIRIMIWCGGENGNPSGCEKVLTLLLPTFKFLNQNQDSKNAEGKFCGGIAANLPENQCPSGYKCKIDGNYPDAGGKCVEN